MPDTPWHLLTGDEADAIGYGMAPELHHEAVMAAVERKKQAQQAETARQAAPQVLSDDKVYDLILDEVARAKKWPNYLNLHEGHGVLLEEVDEFKAHVWMKQQNRDVEAMRTEAVQVAAVAWRIVDDFGRLSDAAIRAWVMPKLSRTQHFHSAHEAYSVLLQAMEAFKAHIWADAPSADPKVLMAVIRVIAIAWHVVATLPSFVRS